MKPTNVIVTDVDDTILFTENRDYANSRPNVPVVEGLRKLEANGWKIVLMSARGMGRSDGNIELVRAEVLAEIERFVEKYDVPCHEIVLAKPFANYYIDDKALRPDEFVEKVDEMIEQFKEPPAVWG